MTKEQIIEQINDSLNEYKGSNEAIDDAAFYIAAEFDKLNEAKTLDQEIIISKFMNWFLKHYSTATIDGFFGYVNATGEEVKIEDILKEYKKSNNIKNN